jgi:Zn-dependent protease
MVDSVRLGRILGIPIGVNWSIIAVAALFTVSLALQGLPLYAPDAVLEERLLAASIGVTVFFATVVAHELGHALVAVGHGVGVSGISLWLLGGVAKLDRQAPTARAELEIAAAGPATSGVLAAFFGALAVISAGTTDHRLATAILAWLGGTNALLAVSNLLPAAPLDGGRVLTALLWKRLGDPELARVISGRCGLILGAGLVIAGAVQILALGQLGGWITALIGLFVFTAARGEIATAAIRRRLRSTTAGDVLVAHPPPIPDTVSVGQLSAWAGASGWTTAYPVVRWGADPIGYVIPRSAARLSAAEQSWTPVSALMRSPDAVHHVESTDTVDEILDRWGEAGDLIAIVRDRRTRLAVGTIAEGQLQSLLVAPDLWGRDRNGNRRPRSPASPGSR